MSDQDVRIVQPIYAGIRLARQLEAELSATNRERKYLLDNARSLKEEPLAANEEALSVNEEVRSTNELVVSQGEQPAIHQEANSANVDLSRDARAVLANMVPIEKDVVAQGDKRYALRVLPYRSEGHIVEGVAAILRLSRI